MDKLPLAGVRVTDLTHYWSGPHCTRILADLGAEVIRVEYLPRLCVMRGGFTDDKGYDKHPRWFQVCRNKSSVTLDLKKPREREILDDLVRVSDVVAENSRPGVMKTLGLNYDELKKLREDVILLSMPACGSTGPWAPNSGVGGSLEPLSGLQELTAYEKDGKRLRIKEADVTSGIMGACAVMTALCHRKTTGQGQWIDMSQLEALSHSLFGEHLLEMEMNGTQTLPQGNRHSRFAPQGCYRCKGHDNWVVITIRSDEEWTSLCNVCEQTGWKTDARFQTNDDRREHHDELDVLIESWTVERDKQEVMHLLQECGIPAGAVVDTSELACDPHLSAREFFKSASDGSTGKYPGNPIRQADWDIRISRRGPDLGADNTRVVTEILGRPASDAPIIRESEIGTGYDPN